MITKRSWMGEVTGSAVTCCSGTLLMVVIHSVAMYAFVTQCYKPHFINDMSLTKIICLVTRYLLSLLITCVWC